MEVKKIFWVDPYLTELEAKITSVDNNIITLDQTIAFAFSGGQQSDSGTIGGYEILEAKKLEKQIFYTIQEDHSLEVEDTVSVKIDWKKRRKIMKLHMAAELILELVYQGYGHPEKIGANITSEKARVDFFWEGNISQIFPELQEKVNKIIDADLDIVKNFSDKENERRYWQIDGFAKVSCGGTHLNKTGEIGKLKFKRKNIGGGKERIEITLIS